VDRPPFWEPWFCMSKALDEYYQGSYLAMARAIANFAP
jgi:hypothetical protein